jgi:Secretion system C-terminal sorting domain
LEFSGVQLHSVRRKSSVDLTASNTLTTISTLRLRQLTLEADQHIRNVHVYDLQGRSVASGATQGMQVTLDLSELAAGMYQVRAQLENGEAVTRLWSKMGE